MKRNKYFMIGLFLTCFLISSVYAACTRENPCCCKEFPYGDKKCFTSGVCCYVGDPREFWNDESCFNFGVWLEPERGMFTVGSETAIKLYIKNLGYDDNYTVNYNVSGESPHLIQVNMNGVTPVNNVVFDETRMVYPGIKVLESHITGNVLFNVTSVSYDNQSRNVTLIVLESDYPLSLPESNVFGLMILIFLAGFLYYKKII